MFRSKLFHHILENICHFVLSLLLSYQIQIFESFCQNEFDFNLKLDKNFCEIIKRIYLQH